MNTHDKIELPPNPITPMLAVLIDKASGTGTSDTVWQLMQEFAYQAIEADRKRRGEPSSLAEVWRLNADEAEAYGQQDRAGTLRECATEVEGLAVPQPAEPVKSHLKVSYDDKGDCLYVVCDSNEPAEAEENEQGVLLRRAFSDGRLVGVTILNFMGRHAEPVKAPSMIDLIADDAYAATFQSVGQYRKALLARYTTTKEQP